MADELGREEMERNGIKEVGKGEGEGGERRIDWGGTVKQSLCAP